MKNVILKVSFLLTATTLFGQTAEIVYPITQEYREESWYKEQQKLWKQKTETNDSDGVAWVNYYTSTRCLRYLARLNNAATGDILNQECNTIIQSVKSKTPKTFEANYLEFWNAGDFLDASLLKAAFNLRPDDTRTYQDLMMHYYLSQNQSEFEAIASRIVRKNVMSPILLNWAHNTLIEVEKNGVILTQGDNDTYALLAVLGNLKRSDVTIVNISMFLSEKYQESCLKLIGLEKVIFVKSKTDLSSGEYTKQCMTHLLSTKRPVFLDCSSDQTSSWNGDQPLSSFSQDFYLNGLTYKYSKIPFDNISNIRKNYEKYYLLDYLNHSFSNHYTDAVAAQQNYSYFPSMMKLRAHYQQCEEFDKAERLTKLMKELGFDKITENK